MDKKIDYEFKVLKGEIGKELFGKFVLLNDITTIDEAFNASFQKWECLSKHVTDGGQDHRYLWGVTASSCGLCHFTKEYDYSDIECSRCPVGMMGFVTCNNTPYNSRDTVLELPFLKNIKRFYDAMTVEQREILKRITNRNEIAYGENAWAEHGQDLDNGVIHGYINGRTPTTIRLVDGVVVLSDSILELYKGLSK